MKDSSWRRSEVKSPQFIEYWLCGSKGSIPKKGIMHSLAGSGTLRKPRVSQEGVHGRGGLA
jgi:hypothetical protein